MAISITITDETNTVTLSATDGYNEDYQPAVPDAGAADVVETLEVTFFGGNATLAANLTKLEQLFSYAREAQNGPLARQVWFKVTLDSEVWRSELYDGKILSSGEWIKGERALGVRKAQIMIRRAPWFEANSAVYAEVSNVYGSGTSSGTLVYNHDDGAHDNHVTVGTISGDLPAPAILTLEGGALPYREVFVGMASYCDAANLALTFEFGTGTNGAGVTPAISTDATDSNNSYSGMTWSGTNEVILEWWYPTTAQITAYAGRIFRPLVRFHSAIGGSTRFWISIGIYYNATGTLEKVWQSEETVVVLTNKGQVLPPIQLPPWAVGNLTSARFALGVIARCEGSGSHTINGDFLLFLPCDSYLRLIPIMKTYPNLNIIYDTQTRLLQNDATVIESHAVEGPGLWLVPGQTNYLVQAQKADLVSWGIANTAWCKLQYRPRKRTL